MNRLACTILLFFFSTSALLIMGCGQTGSSNSGDKKNSTDLSFNQDKKSQNYSDDLTKKVNPEKAAIINVELGLAYLDTHQPARGKVKLQRALELAPALPEVHAAFGRYYESIGELEEAEKSYVKALKMNKHSAVSHNLYGAFLCRQGKYEKAHRAFQKALEDKTYPESASVLENTGLCELAAGNKEKARIYFEKAVRQDINRANSLLELAYMHYEQKSVDIAWQLYNRYLIVANQTPRSLYLGVKLARNLNYKDKEASYLLLLKSEYHDSLEYQKLERLS
jgi:type IV pilus assembly protein PilF